jgi:hypothetical protein
MAKASATFSAHTHKDNSPPMVARVTPHLLFYSHTPATNRTIFAAINTQNAQPPQMSQDRNIGRQNGPFGGRCMRSRKSPL